MVKDTEDRFHTQTRSKQRRPMGNESLTEFWAFHTMQVLVTLIFIQSYRPFTWLEYETAPTSENLDQINHKISKLNKKEKKSNLRPQFLAINLYISLPWFKSTQQDKWWTQQMEMTEAKDRKGLEKSTSSHWEAADRITTLPQGGHTTLRAASSTHSKTIKHAHVYCILEYYTGY